MAGNESVATGNWDTALNELAARLLNQLHEGLTADPVNMTASAAGGDKQGDGPASAGAGPRQDPLAPVWNALLEALASLSVVAKKLADGEPQPGSPAGQSESAAITPRIRPQSTADHYLGLAALINDYLTFLRLPHPEQDNGTASGASDRLALRLAELHAAVRSTSPIGIETEQRLELIQASADTEDAAGS